MMLSMSTTVTFLSPSSVPDLIDAILEGADSIEAKGDVKSAWRWRNYANDLGVALDRSLVLGPRRLMAPPADPPMPRSRQPA
jgi:hypothetical protein